MRHIDSKEDEMTFYKEINEFKELFKDEIENFRGTVNEALEKCVRYEYVSGESGFDEGYYNPSWAIDHIVGGVKRGKILKIKDPKKYSYKYGFDSDGRIIISHTYYGRSHTYRLYKYVANNIYTVNGMLSGFSDSILFDNYTKAVFDERKRILEYSAYNTDLDFNILCCDSWLYDYCENKITVIFRQQGVDNPEQNDGCIVHTYDEPYEFILDENGNMLYYTSSDGRRYELNPKAINPFQQNYQ